jgi:hypothetical protein
LTQKLLGGMWYSKVFKAWNLPIQYLTNSRYSYFLLLLLSGIAVMLSLMAYAPADGADGGDYLLHAAYLAGYEVPANFEAHPPIYPMMISFFFFQLGQIYILVALQIIMAVLVPLLFYAALKPYSSVLGFMLAIVVAFDMQMLILYNFIATEAAYMFFLALNFFLLMRQLSNKETKLWGDMLLVFTLILTAYTRSVGQYLIIPVALLYIIKTRNPKRLTVLIITYILGVQLFLGGYKLFFQIENVKANTESNTLLMQPITRSGLLRPENGEASRQMILIMENCPDAPPYSPCVFVAQGGMQEGQKLIRDTYIEMIFANPFGYAWHVLNNMTDFLQMSGLQYDESPARAQCTNVTARIERGMVAYTQEDPLLVGVEYDEAYLRATIEDINAKFCPPLRESEIVRNLVNYIASRYRSLGRPQPWIYYGSLVLALLFLPFARKLWPAAVAALLILLYHAGISALIYNVQARYIVVTNGFRALILVMLVYIIIRAVLHLLDAFLAQRETA